MMSLMLLPCELCREVAVNAIESTYRHDRHSMSPNTKNYEKKELIG
jgi:hypothetical protein